MRFQITWIHAIFFKPLVEWDDADEPPIIRREFLCDVVNCPGKTGDVVYDCMVKQWSQLGIGPDECVAGVGDGGGENEGQEGVHSLIEGRCPSYVRRRCLLHLPWRVADQGLAEMGSLHDETKAISTYIHEGCTWHRFKSIAVQQLGFVEGSPAFQALFRRAPPNNQDDRPATTCIFLQWLDERKHILGRVAKIDMDKRQLQSKHSKLAVPSLGSHERCILRRVASVLMNKALFLFYFTEGKQHVALHANLTDLFEKAANIISDTRTDEYVLRQLNVTEETLVGLGIDNRGVGTNWLELVVRLEPDVTNGERDIFLDTCIKFHTRVSLRMRTHLSLMAKNIDRTTWVAARLSNLPKLRMCWFVKHEVVACIELKGVLFKTKFMHVLLGLD